MTIDAGVYRGRAREWALGEAGNGTEQVAVLFDLSDDEGKSVAALTWFGSFNGDKATEITLKALRTMGWKGDDIADLNGLSENEVRLVVEHETYQGKTQVRIKWVNAMGGLSLKAPLSQDKARAFAARMRGAVAKFNQENGKPRAPTASRNGAIPPEPPPPTDHHAPPGVDDDLPF